MLFLGLLIAILTQWLNQTIQRLESGVTLPWTDILDRIRSSVRGADLPAICTTCPWLPLGWCAEAIDGLRTPSRGIAPPQG